MILIVCKKYLIIFDNCVREFLMYFDSIFYLSCICFTTLGATSFKLSLVLSFAPQVMVEPIPPLTNIQLFSS